MKIGGQYMLKILTGLVLVSSLTLAMSGCRREVETINGGQNPTVAFQATIDAPFSDTRLTPSDVTTGGVFEVGDNVGLYLFDQKGDPTGATGAYSYVNTPYIASLVGGKVIFAPEGDPKSIFYKTYYLHNVYAYYPYNSSNTALGTAVGIKVGVNTDQSSAKSYALSDFLTCRLADVVPQQINPSSPELEMKFLHQFTSVVVKVRVADNSAFSPTPVVSIMNMATTAVVDISKAVPAFSLLDIVTPVLMQQKIGYSDVNFTNQLCFKGIIVPQQFDLGKSLIKVKIGTGTTARTYEYTPLADDPIALAGGFMQGKEHVLDFVISGTELLVQGGQVVDWGVGSRSVTEIDGGGKSAAKMIFEVVNSTADVALFKSADITIDGKVRTTTTFTYDAVSTPSTISCNYYQGDDWGQYFEKVEFKDASGVTKMSCTPAARIRITGNPISEAYNIVIGVIDAQTGGITEK